MIHPTHEEFLERVEDFQMTVLKDDGVYRHLRFRKPDTIAGSFDIVTWPMHLSYSGDMGDYVFERHTDMLTFFRRNKPEDTGINPCYWSEKLQAVDKHCGYSEFSTAVFEEKLKDDFETYWEFDSPEQKEKAWDAIEWDLINYPDDVDSAITKACQYECPITKQEFVDFWEHNLNEYTFHFIFCCRAIPWAIEVYDNHKAAQSA